MILIKLYLYEALDFDDNTYSDLVVATDPKKAIDIVRWSYEEDGFTGYKLDRIKVTEVNTVCGYKVFLEKI
ncbi:hypothetical protein D3C87_980400 [compost metagenome]